MRGSRFWNYYHDSDK